MHTQAMTDNQYEIIVVGAGIAGVAAGAYLSKSAEVLILEMEDQPGYHATGRSAAFFTTTFGNELSRKIGRIVSPFFRSPPDELTDVALLRPRNSIFVAGEDQLDRLNQVATELGADVTPITGREICRRVPILKPESIAAGLLDKTGGELDSDALLQGYIKQLHRFKGNIKNRAQVEALQYERGNWTVTTRDEKYAAPIVINAAGAWVDTIAGLAGLNPLNVEPLKRTVILVEAPENTDVSTWPMIVDIGGEIYFKPDAGLILISPSDESLAPACDVQPDEMDIAIAVDRFETVTTMEVRRVNHQWAGLRTFTIDRNPVAGFDPRIKGFFWLAGLGGFGIATAPALAQLTNSLICDVQPDPVFEDILSLTSELSPERLITD